MGDGKEVIHRMTKFWNLVTNRRTKKEHPQNDAGCVFLHTVKTKKMSITITRRIKVPYLEHIHILLQFY